MKPPSVTSDQGLVSSGLVNYTVTIDRIGELSISELNIPTLDNTEAHNLRVSPRISVTEYDLSSRVTSTQNIENIVFNVPEDLWENETTPETSEISSEIRGMADNLWLELSNYVPTTETSLTQEAINTVNQMINDQNQSSLRDRLRGFSSTLTDDEIRTWVQTIF